MINDDDVIIKFSKVQKDAESVINDFIFNENPLLALLEKRWRPNTDIYETKNGIIVKIELSGVEKKDIEILYEDNKLKIKGKREDHSPPDKIIWHQIEINYGDFYREINIPSKINPSEISATFKNGFLFIFFSFKNLPGKVKINIEEK